MTQNNQITIDRIDMGTGWVCFQAGKKPPDPDRLPGFLNNRAFYSWLQRNSEFKVTSVLPIIGDGDTVLFHVWFE